MTKLNYIMLEELQDERTKIFGDFTDLKTNIQKVETDLLQMKNNLNAIAGAVQLLDRLIESAKKQVYDTEMYKEKKKITKKK